MQTSWSSLNGWIAPCLRSGEEEVLKRVFGMRMGWEGVYDEQTVVLARVVNPSVPGEGRFTGVVAGRESS